MIIIPDRCTAIKTDTTVTLREHKSTFTIRNPKRSHIKVITVDGCAITSGRRCDYLFVDQSGTEHYVELKGCHVSDAIDQLEQTILLLSKSNAEVKFAFVSCQSCPRLRSIIQVKKKLFRKKYNAFLQINSQIVFAVN